MSSLRTLGAVPDPFLFRSGPEWLARWHRSWREVRSSHTLGQLAKDTGVKKSLISMVLHGKRVPTGEVLRGLNAAWGLDARRLRYLELLYARERRLSPREAEEVERELASFAEAAPQGAGEEAVSGLADRWEQVILREAARRSPLPPDPAKVAQGFRMGAALGSVERALDELRSSGRLVPLADGTLVAAQDAVASSPNVADVRDYHRQALASAAVAIEQVPADERVLNVLTLGVPRGWVGRVRALVWEALSRLAEEADRQPSSEEVLQLTVQVLPVYRSVGDQAGVYTPSVNEQSGG